jgi:soluble lytic murein transglycosylase-like protein
MVLFRLIFLLICAAAAAGSSPARADVYGFVDGGRVSVMYADAPPADGRYVLFKKGVLGGPAGAEGLPPSKYSGQVLAAARETRVDPALIHAVIAVESGYNPAARSSAGAVGLMQLMPETARHYGVKNRLDPAQSIQGGARYLRDLKILFGDDLSLVLAAYNAGENAVLKYGRRIPPFAETAAYVPKVLSAYRKFRPAASGG